ncbi:hypothetical protein GCM10010435_16720 [Winogradskya consettensis]|uniref:Uncharacterized protein n=1 Tax=Winogradskya consettensis TaxID=113560 RepID=A0A919SVL4_9ACTN|nr:hypothetical protein [Actinoplanes consettensis]GIM78809.1 hypothetical protein Aco04nite_62330 [Actinoplanes consettensis]
MRSSGIQIRHVAGAVLALSLVGAAAALPWSSARPALLDAIVRNSTVQYTAVGIAVFMVAALVLRRSRLSRSGLGLAGGRGASLLLHLWPVVTLTAVYPTAAGRMAGYDVGGIPLTEFLLAVALVLPWLLQGVCMPLYRAIGDLSHDGNLPALRRGFVAAIPGTIVQAIPAVIISAVPLAFLLHWSPEAILTFIGLLLLDVLFAQSLVLANVTRSRSDWVIGWSAYAVAVLIAPTWWWLPPLVGLVTQVIPLWRYLKVRPTWLNNRTVSGDILQGLLLGAVMWGDKVFYFYATGGDFPVVTLFLASLPAVIAYNFYFICRTPEFDASVKNLHSAMSSEPMNRLGSHSKAVYSTAARSIQDSAFVGAILVGLTAILLWSTTPRYAALIGGITAACWLCTVISIACYKLEYVGERRTSRAIGAFHLLVCAIAFASSLPDATAYLVLVAGDTFALVVALVLFRRAWRTPEHTLFWRRALTW